MFKGLRNKIEIEQKAAQNKGLEAKSNPIPQVPDNIIKSSSNNSIKETTIVQRLPTGSVEKNIQKENNDITSNLNRSLNTTAYPSNDEQAKYQPITKTTSTTSTQSLLRDSSQRNVDLLAEITDLKSEIARLHDQLRSVIKERDESNDQNVELYQIIEKLRRNLECEKDTNSSIRAQLDEAQKKNSNPVDKKTNISLKSSDTPEVDQLKLQLSDKNRQLKVKQQNLNDIKKTLQKEMFEHSKAREEISVLQETLKQFQLQSNQPSTSTDTVTNNPVLNGSTCDTDSNLNINFDPIISDRDLEEAQADGTSLTLMDHSQNNNDTNNEINEVAAGVSVTPQMDKMSYMSRSSASVDDFDGSDLQHNQQNSCNIGVNHEYLKNVMYRYMTSTDTETARHLVKALSVLMNFTPEQSAAVKSAMNSRTSWLRLR